MLHGLRGRSNRRIDEEQREKAVAILKGDVYKGFGPTLASEYLAKKHDIEVSKETVRKWMRAAGLWRVRKQRVTEVHQWRERRERLLDAHQLIIGQVRRLARRATELGDDGRNDLAVSEVLRRNELQAWFLSEHLVYEPLVHAK